MTPDILLERSRHLRDESTEAEKLLWSRLRAGRLHGLKFRRQTPIGRYIADFICPAAKLVVELDGSQHVEASAYDEARSAFLQTQGYRVLRFWNNDALSRTGDVLGAILHAIEHPLPGGFAACPSPLQGEGR